MRIVLLLIHVATYLMLLLFDAHARSIICPEVIVNTPEQKHMVKMTNVNDINSSRASRRRTSSNLDWLRRHNITIWRNNDGALYHPFRIGNTILHYPIAYAIFPKQVSPIVRNNDVTSSNTRNIDDTTAQHAAAAAPTATNEERIGGVFRTISSAKCEEYAKDIEKLPPSIEILSPVDLSPPRVKVRGKLPCQMLGRSLVSAGSRAAPGVYAHMAALGRHGEDGAFTLRCGGSLISHAWVLTAAHCTHGLRNDQPTVVLLGTRDLRDRHTGVTIPIEKTIRHPDYKPPAMYADIGLAKLQRVVAFGAYIRPACLYQSYDRSPTRAWISGWGETEFAGGQSDQLRHAPLDIIDNVSCAVHYNTSGSIPRGITTSMICAQDAGDEASEDVKDSCPGDSGGPLQVASKRRCTFEVVGITSFGEACAIKGSPGVYTRVSHYIPWVERIVWPNETNSSNSDLP